MKTKQTHTLKNEQLTISINAKGAELTSIKTDILEYMWQADPQFWGRHAPILFPIVGRLVDHEYNYKGKTYSLPQHGFARDADFELVATNDNSITLELKETDESKKAYPFDFILQVKYTLSENKLTTEYIVKNPSDSENLYFSIGAHPAFNCPFEMGQKRNEFELIFDKEIAPEVLLHTNGLYDGGLCAVVKPEGTIDITDALFDKDSFTFSPNPFSKVTFRHKPSQKDYLSIAFENYPFLAIWSKNNTSPFVCIEPWHGIADRKDHNKEFTEKEGIVRLGAENEFSCSFVVEVH